MQDRISQYPGRIKLIPVDANNGIYDVVRADEPTQEGTPLNTANLFSSATSQHILAYTQDFNKIGAANPDTVDLGIRRICTFYGAYEWAPRCNFVFEGNASGKARVVDASIKYLASLGAVFVSVSFRIIDQTYSTPAILIKAESYDPAAGALFERLYGNVPMISSIPESTRRPSMNNQDGSDLYIEIPAAATISAANGTITVVGMYQCRTIFTIYDYSTSGRFKLVVCPGITWSEWIGTSRIIDDDSGLKLYTSSNGIIFANEAGTRALSLDGSTAVLGSDTIKHGADYTIISYGG